MSDPQEVPAKPETFVVNKVGKTQLTMAPAILGENSGRSMLYYTHTHTHTHTHILPAMQEPRSDP